MRKIKRLIFNAFIIIIGIRQLTIFLFIGQTFKFNYKL